MSEMTSGLVERKPHFTFQHSTFEPDTIMIGRPEDDQYKRFNFDLCRAIDMTKVSIVLGQMVESGALDQRMAELFHMQAATLLAVMRSENNRTFAARAPLPAPPAKDTIV